MAKNEGLLIFFDEERRQDLLIKKREDGGFSPFSDALSLPDWEISQLEIALLCFSESTIDFLALVSKGNRVATAKHRVKFSELLDLGSVSIDVIERQLNSNIRRYFVRSSQGTGGRLPQKTWETILKIIKGVRQNLIHDINRITSLGRISGYYLKGDVANILLQEREAFGVALDVFSGNNHLRQRILGGWAPEDNQIVGLNEEVGEATLINLQPSHSSFMSNIESRYLQEESVLQHDLFNWEGISKFHQAGASVFYQGNRKLEVIYANRNALENTLGVDLIYYNEFFKSFVLVQYKLMVESSKEYRYRPDKQLLDEIRRMDEFNKRCISSNEVKSHEDFRLNSDGFMIKLVPNYGLKPASGELIKGMYLARSYMKFLIGPKGPKGKKGGSIITFSNSPRYMTNTEFIQAVNRGWIGTRNVQTDTLKELIKQYYETGRAVLVACESSR